MANPLRFIKKELPYLNVEWFLLSPWFEFDMIYEDMFEDTPINYKFLSLHKSVTPEIVSDNPDIPWCFKSLSSNPNITIEFIYEYRDREWNWDSLTINENIKMKDIFNNEELPFNMGIISCNLGITEKEMLDYGFFDNGYMNDNISMEFLLLHKDIIDYSWFQWQIAASQKKDVTFELLFKYPRFDWNCGLGNKNLDPNIMIEWNGNNFDKEAFSSNPNIRYSTLKKYSNVHWDWKEISRNINHIEDYINHYKDNNWDKSQIIFNPNITISMIREYKKYDLNLDMLKFNCFSGDYWKKRDKRIYDTIKYRKISRMKKGIGM